MTNKGLFKVAAALIRVFAIMWRDHQKLGSRASTVEEINRIASGLEAE